MELWIRSQDRKLLVKINRIDVDGYRIQGNHSDIDYVTLGNYKNEERVLEILDEIQRYLVIINDSDNYFYVYEMPKE